jgi:hypothetical protein
MGWLQGVTSSRDAGGCATGRHPVAESSAHAEKRIVPRAGCCMNRPVGGWVGGEHAVDMLAVLSR